MTAHRVMVVDDYLANHLVMEVLLRECCRIEFADNGKEAVSKHFQHPFDLILMDLYMPIMDGAVAARKIRQIEQQQGKAVTPIIVLTAAAESTQTRAIIPECFDDCLTKPVDRKALYKLLSKYLGGKFDLQAGAVVHGS